VLFGYFVLLILYLSVQVCASVSGKFGAVLASIPLSIIAAIYCILFAYVGKWDIH